MNNEVNNIGDIFRETLKNHRLETNADLWGRLESQLPSQPHIVTPKASLLKTLPLAKVAAAASLIVSVALAYNYIYLPLVTPAVISTPNNQVITDTKVQTDSVLSPVQPENSVNESGNSNNFVANNFSDKTDKNTSKPENDFQLIQNYNNYQANNQNNNYLSPVDQQSNKNNESSNLITKVDSTKEEQNIVSKQNDQNNSSIEQTKEQSEKTLNEEITDLQIPNIFTPNSDGVNDYFVIKNIDKYLNNQLIISNRQGKVIFEKSGYQNTWDANNIPDGVYYYVLKCRFRNNDFVKMGMITIAR